ncbi:MAG: hypothetical protein EA385_11305 [Salinarimonadaceae bacterium]|nr:MAG: hypothetical protein EA385_11305 [Salinarimonadaceae bacterium]
MPFFSPSILILVAVNLIPLGGVLFYGWTVFELLALFWAENVVIGLLNLVKMGTVLVLAGRKDALFTMPFFLVHYGLFTLVHGVFLFQMFSPAEDIDFAIFLIPLAALALSHVASYAVNFIGRGEYLRLTAQDLMTQPYGRVVALHLTIIFGAFVVAALGEPLYALALLVVLKTAIDLAAHVREHAKAQSKNDIDA